MGSVRLLNYNNDDRVNRSANQPTKGEVGKKGREKDPVFSRVWGDYTKDREEFNRGDFLLNEDSLDN